MRVATILVLVVCSCGSDRPPHFYSFETGLEGWQRRGIDLELGPGSIAWSIETSTRFASDGHHSLEVFLANWNDMAKIFIEKSFTLEPHHRYRVDLTFELASQDNEVNPFRVIAGALARPPMTHEDLAPVFQAHALVSSDARGYVWLRRRHSTFVETDVNGVAVIVVGIWGTWETPRTYYFDALGIDFVKVAEVAPAPASTTGVTQRLGDRPPDVGSNAERNLSAVAPRMKG